MQQTDRIELIKAAAILTQAKYFSQGLMHDDSSIMSTFNIFYDYLQIKLEAANND